MGKILEYSNLGAPPADNDLLFMGDYSANASNPTTMRLTIADLNKKRNVDAADGNGLMLRDDGGNYGLFIKDGGNVGVGAATAEAQLHVSGGDSTPVMITRPSNGHNAFVKFQTSSTNDWLLGTRNITNSDFHLYSYGTSTNVLTILRSNGNVGIGVATPAAKLDIAGDFKIVDGSYGIKIDADLANIEGITSGGASGPLHLNRSGGEDIWFMYASSTDFAGKVESTNKRWSIGSKSPAGAKLHIYESAGADNVALQLENRVASGSPNSILRFTRTVGSTSLEQQVVWDGTQLGIRNVSAVTLGSDSVNFRAGSLDVGATGFTRKFNVTDSSNIVANFNSSDNNGTKILIRNTSNAAAAVQHSLIAFPNKIGSNEIANWMTGAYKDNANPDNNYFMIHYSSQTAPTDGQYVFDTTTTNNAMRLDTSGNVRFKGTMEASAYYDQGGNTAGNYCRGRFLQTFSLPYYADELNRFSPLLAAPFDRTDDTAGSTITAKFASVAPHDGRVQSFRASAKNNQAATTNCDLYIYTGASLPSGTELGDSDSAKVASDNSQLQLASLANQKVTLGYDDFSNKTRLDFSQGDYLIFSIDTDSGNAHINIDITVEFYIDDTL